MSKLNTEQKERIVHLKSRGYSCRKIAQLVLGRSTRKSTVNDYLQRYLADSSTIVVKPQGPRILSLDIESAPIRGAVWSLWKQNVGLNQIETDWFILGYCAKWYDAADDDVHYRDLRGIVAEEDDTILLDELWDLLDEADIVLTQNGKRFDTKKINARFILNGYPPPSLYKQIDTLEIAKNRFGFTSNKLEYMTDKINTKYKKLKHGKFPGFALWAECLKDNPEAWDEMEEYNIHDVLSLEELYTNMQAWDNRHPNVTLYGDVKGHVCSCGSTEFTHNGYYFTQVSKFKKYRCDDCGAEYRDRKNTFTKEQRSNIMVRV